ncbi:MAG: type VI secretion system contractile sheath large subunit [Acidobacteriota bacterium]|jgi:type VI secretion system protein ImpC
MAARLEFELSTEPKTAYRKAAGGPMRLLVMGDFSGRENRGLQEPGTDLAGRPLVPVDVDNLEDVLFRFSPQLFLPAVEPSGPGMTVEFRSLEDFHPDALFGRLELFEALRGRRSRLLDPATYADAARDLLEGSPAPPPESPGTEPTPEDDAGTLERLLGRRPAGPRPAPGRLDLDGLIRRIVAPHIVPGPDPQQAQLVAAVDAGIGDRVRALLHDPAFQALESAWRSLDRLVSGVETGEDLRILVLDCTRDELAADVRGAGGDLAACGFFRALERGKAGGDPWSALVADFAFADAPGDLELLGALGAIASHAGGPLLAGASPALPGSAPLAEPARWPAPSAAWGAFRSRPAARWTGLAMPRVLLRLPYGAKTDPIDAFAFEEIPGAPRHEQFLWGGPAFACAALIARAFQERGWEMEPGDFLELEDLPAYVVVEDGETRMQAPTEAYLAERAGGAILERGIMPLMGYRDRNAARLLRFQSMADPPAGLAGPWA